jgi:hypothetical protein
VRVALTNKSRFAADDKSSGLAAEGSADRGAERGDFPLEGHGVAAASAGIGPQISVESTAANNERVS